MAIGDIVHFPGEIVTLTAGAGGVSKGDMVYLSAVDTVLAIDAVSKYCIGMACEDIAEDAKGPVLIFAPVVKATLVSATVGKPLVYSATGLTNLTETALATGVECISVVGIAWDTVSAADEGRVMLIHGLFRDTGYAAS
ncbi:MAG: DUF2190 family protein [Desulfobacterales bacterium]|nr:DUF2190 family protein [Desulfobacterales bacterium]